MNWGALKTAVAAYANRTDLTAMFPTFLEMAEQRIYFGSEMGGLKSESLRHSSMLTIVSPFTGPIPADNIEIRRVSWVDGTRKHALDFLPLERIGELGAAGSPAYYSINGQTMVYGPTFSQDVELIYYAKYETPSADADVNYLLTNASNIYLQALLIEVWTYLRDATMGQIAMSSFVSAINSFMDEDDSSVHSGATLRMVTDQRRII